MWLDDCVTHVPGTYRVPRACPDGHPAMQRGDVREDHGGLCAEWALCSPAPPLLPAISGAV